MSPNLGSRLPLLEFWCIFTYYYNFCMLSVVRPSDVVNIVWPWQVGNTHRWRLCSALKWGWSYGITTATCYWLWWQVLVKRNGCILLYCKGADSTVYPCLHSSCQALMDQTAEHMNVRQWTLCIYKNVISSLFGCFRAGTHWRQSRLRQSWKLTWSTKLLTLLHFCRCFVESRLLLARFLSNNCRSTIFIPTP